MRVGMAVVFLAALGACKESKPKPMDTTGAAQTEAKPKKQVDPLSVGTVTGTVTFQGTLPAATMIRASGDAACAKEHPNEFSADDVKVKDGRVEDAFVWVKSGLEDYEFPMP